MSECFRMNMNYAEVGELSSLALAHVGDAVYELLVRSMLCGRGIPKAEKLHRMTVSYVSAAAQAAAAARILESLTEEEVAVYKRGRNAHVHSIPKGATPGEYHAATALEALFGWLYLTGKNDRIAELFAAMMEADGNAT